MSAGNGIDLDVLNVAPPIDTKCHRPPSAKIQRMAGLVTESQMWRLTAYGESAMRKRFQGGGARAGRMSIAARQAA
jgi:hypothetical protein